MPNFPPGASKVAQVAGLVVLPVGLSSQAEIFVGPDANTKVATSGPIAFTATGVVQTVSLPITMPAINGIYHTYLNITSGGTLAGAYISDDITIAPTNVPPAVVTNLAEIVSAWKIKLKGTLSSLGSAQSVRVSFEIQWSTDLGFSIETIPTTLTAPGDFNATVNLPLGEAIADWWTYACRVRAVGDGGVYGSVLVFKTSPTGLFSSGIYFI